MRLPRIGLTAAGRRQSNNRPPKQNGDWRCRQPPLFASVRPFPREGSRPGCPRSGPVRQPFGSLRRFVRVRPVSGHRSASSVPFPFALPVPPEGLAGPAGHCVGKWGRLAACAARLTLLPPGTRPVRSIAGFPEGPPPGSVWTASGALPFLPVSGSGGAALRPPLNNAPGVRVGEAESAC